MSEGGGDDRNILEKITGTGKSSKPSSSSGGNAKLNKTLNSLNAAISQLPGRMQTAISTAEITVTVP